MREHCHHAPARDERGVEVRDTFDVKAGAQRDQVLRGEPERLVPVPRVGPHRVADERVEVGGGCHSREVSAQLGDARPAAAGDAGGPGVERAARQGIGDGADKPPPRPVTEVGEPAHRGSRPCALRWTAAMRCATVVTESSASSHSAASTA